MIRKRLVYLIVASMLLSLFTMGVSAHDNKVYLEPRNSTVQPGETTDVEIWINATGFQGGQINLTYNSSYVNVTGFVNGTEFPLWYWNSITDGEEWILFAAKYSENLPLEGEYKVGTLTIEGVLPGTTTLGFGDNSSIFDDYGNETMVDWVSGDVTVNPASDDRVYFDPHDNSALSGDSVMVEIWVNATNFQSGQMYISYESTCANITGWARDAGNFPMGTWTHTDGNDQISFIGLNLKSGEYLIGTLIIEGVCEEDECTTPLGFSAVSKLTDDYGNEVIANWIGGSFTCKVGICGDVNCDEVIDIGDVTLLLNHWSNPTKYPLCDEWAGDVNCDGTIDIGDVTLLLNHVNNPDEYELGCCKK